MCVFPLCLRPQENVFAIIACIQLRTPLIIVGPPGSSKTLSFQIVQQTVLNDATVRDSVTTGKENPPFFAGFLSVEAGVFHYQCSEHSTSKYEPSCVCVSVTRSCLIPFACPACVPLTAR